MNIHAYSLWTIQLILLSASSTGNPSEGYLITKNPRILPYSINIMYFYKLWFASSWLPPKINRFCSKGIPSWSLSWTLSTTNNNRSLLVRIFLNSCLACSGLWWILLNICLACSGLHCFSNLELVVIQIWILRPLESWITTLVFFGIIVLV